MKKHYKHYIFDLYGTLLDIGTDEQKPSLWSLMAKTYNACGCGWKGPALKEAFFRADKEERRILKDQTGVEFPEIKLERVFARMLLECAEPHATDACVTGMSVEALWDAYRTDRQNVLMRVAGSEWCALMANLFRVHSRSYMRVHACTFEALDILKKRGCGIWLLSNAAAVFTRPEIEQSGLKPYFDGIYLSSDYGMMKPEAAFMELLLKREGIDRGTAVMAGNEDRSDMEIARRCHMDGFLVDPVGDLSGLL